MGRAGTRPQPLTSAVALTPTAGRKQGAQHPAGSWEQGEHRRWEMSPTQEGRQTLMAQPGPRPCPAVSTQPAPCQPARQSFLEAALCAPTA